MSDTGGAKQTGQKAVGSLKRSLSTRLAEAIRSDPEWAEQAADIGLVDRAWLEDPAAAPMRTAPPAELVQRFLERTSERRPSVMARLGMGALQALSLAQGETTSGETTPVTVLFTDFEGFTNFTAEQGDEAAATLITHHHRRVGPTVRSRGGHIVKNLGDGMMVRFPAPEAAVLAAVEMVDRADEPLRLRAGLHLGEAVITADDLLGHVVNVAARITEQARGGEVLASTDVRDAVGDLRGVTFSRPKRTRLKGLEAMGLCRVTADR